MPRRARVAGSGTCKALAPLVTDVGELPDDLAQRIVEARGGGSRCQVSAKVAAAERDRYAHVNSLAWRIADAQTREAYATLPEDQRAAARARDDARIAVASSARAAEGAPIAEPPFTPPNDPPAPAPPQVLDVPGQALAAVNRPDPPPVLPGSREAIWQNEEEERRRALSRRDHDPYEVLDEEL